MGYSTRSLGDMDAGHCPLRPQGPCHRFPDKPAGARPISAMAPPAAGGARTGRGANWPRSRARGRLTGRWPRAGAGRGHRARLGHRLRLLNGLSETPVPEFRGKSAMIGPSCRQPALTLCPAEPPLGWMCSRTGGSWASNGIGAVRAPRMQRAWWSRRRRLTSRNRRRPVIVAPAAGPAGIAGPRPGSQPRDAGAAGPRRVGLAGPDLAGRRWTQGSGRRSRPGWTAWRSAGRIPNGLQAAPCPALSR